MRSFLRDLRFAARQLARRPGLTGSVTLTLAIGIAAAATAFAVVNAAFVKPLAVVSPDELVHVYTSRSTQLRYQSFSYPDYLDVASSGAFAGAFGYSGLLATWSHDGRADMLFGELVTGSYFQVLGVQPALGRLLSPDDDRVAGEHAVVVLGHSFWRQRLGGRRDVVGEPLVLNGQSFTIVGVAPPEFTGLLFRGFTVDVWAPTAMMGQLRADQLGNRNERWMFVRGRLAPGVSVGQAAAALDTLADRLAADYPDTNAGRVFRVVPSSQIWISPDADGPLKLMAMLLIGTCLLVLAIGASNVLGLLVARMFSRSRDLAVQAALGATRTRLWMQVLAESTLLAIGGGGVGLLLTAGVASWLSAYRPATPVPLAFDVAIDQRVTLFAVGLTVLAAAGLAVAQVWWMRRADLTAGLRSWMAPARAARSRRHWLLVPQVAGAVVLLVLAGLLTRSTMNASSVERGFDIDGVGMLTFNAGGGGRDLEDARMFFDRLLLRAREMPGVAAASVTDRTPLDLYGGRAVPVTFGDSAPVGVQVAAVADDYFAVFGIAERAGRMFAPADLAAGSGVAIVNDAFVAQVLAARAPLGQAVTVQGTARTIIGVVGNAKVQTLGESPTPLVYLPIVSEYTEMARIVVRTREAPGPVLEELTRVAASLRPDIAVVERRTMAESVGVMLLPFEAGSAAAGLLGVVALGLAAVGLHGLVAFVVATRTREFGVRLALGETPGGLIRTAARQTARATAVGLVVGLGAAVLLAQALGGFVFGIAALDPLAFGAAAGTVLAIAMLSVLGPVRRAARTDVCAALRAE